MALQFFADSACTIPVTQLSPKRFLALLQGQSKTSSLWLADPDTGTSIAKYLSNGNMQIYVYGPDLQRGISVALKKSTDATYLLAGLPLILSQTQIQVGVAHAVQVDIQVTVTAGVEQEFTNWGIQTGQLFAATSVQGSIPSGAAVLTTVAPGYLHQVDYGLTTTTRIFPLNRQVSPDLPGFIVGQYRWRDQDTRNATALVPTSWNIDPVAVGLEKFIPGIGDNDDLELTELIASGDSIYAAVNRGFYYTGAYQYYLPAGFNLEFVPSFGTNLVHTLQQIPVQQRPIFVGNWSLDSYGFYEKSVVYRYAGVTVNPDDSPRTDLPAQYFTVDWPSSTITLSQPMAQQTVYLGTLSGFVNDYFDLAIYPVDSVVSVFVDRGVGNPPVYTNAYAFDREKGTVTLTAPSGSGISVPNGLAGEAVYATVNPAVAILYETGGTTRTVSDVDLNPAFAGLSSGYFYLQQRRQKAATVVLSCDKPRIDIPASISSIIDLVAYGPVYFENDYALLQATAYSLVPGEIVPNARLKVIVGEDFSGYINYQDPTTETVEVVTGGDGVANMVFTPKPGFGVYIPLVPASGTLAGLITTTVSNDTIQLPDGVPISQIRNDAEGWLVTTYLVKNNDPLYGMVGGDPSLGEIPWATSGTPGTDTYKTNGERDAWRVGTGPTSTLVEPIKALDSSGVNYDQPGFSGIVKTLVYASSLPLDSTIGALFITFLQRVTIQMQVENSNVFSNTVLLQLAVPGLINENPWLIINDSVNGLINQFRLGFVPTVNRGV